MENELSPEEIAEELMAGIDGSSLYMWREIEKAIIKAIKEERDRRAPADSSKQIEALREALEDAIGRLTGENYKFSIVELRAALSSSPAPKAEPSPASEAAKAYEQAAKFCDQAREKGISFAELAGVLRDYARAFSKPHRDCNNGCSHAGAHPCDCPKCLPAPKAEPATNPKPGFCKCPIVHLPTCIPECAI